eukprot:scaffold8094_cov376-Prasinococcus_capsulatus_cf.AAC.4
MPPPSGALQLLLRLQARVSAARSMRPVCRAAPTIGGLGLQSSVKEREREREREKEAGGLRMPCSGRACAHCCPGDVRVGACIAGASEASASARVRGQRWPSD